jgi:hypothetical protein
LGAHPPASNEHLRRRHAPPDPTAHRPYALTALLAEYAVAELWELYADHPNQTALQSLCIAAVQVESHALACPHALL